MKRRDFVKNLSAAGLLSMMDPGYLAAREALQAGQKPDQPVARRKYGSTDDSLSIICFGGIVVMNVTPEQATNYVAEAVDRGVNYFDVAPMYGNAQQRLGPALKPYREKSFLACKTNRRDAAGAKKELEDSLKKLQTDHFDLYQLHHLTTMDDVEQAFGPGGAMETFREAKQQGKVRYLGFSAHSEEAALAALDRFDFDSVLFPMSFPLWLKEDFGPTLHKRLMEKKRGILAIKAMAYQKWPKETKPEDRRWKKTWYVPLDTVDQAALGLRFTLNLPVNAMVPPGHWELFKMALDLAQSGALTPLNEQEREIVATMAEQADPIFTKHAEA